MCVGFPTHVWVFWKRWFFPDKLTVLLSNHFKDVLLSGKFHTGMISTKHGWFLLRRDTFQPNNIQLIIQRFHVSPFQKKVKKRAKKMPKIDTKDALDASAWVSLHNRKAVFVSWGNDPTRGGGHIAIRQLLARHIHVSCEIHSTNRVPAIKRFSCFSEIIWHQYPAFETSSIILRGALPLTLTLV